MTTPVQRAVPPADDAIAAVAARLLSGADAATIRRVEQGVSTFVYRVRRREETYDVRVLPEIGDSFVPEARVHGLARARGEQVPDVLVINDRDPVLGLSIMITAELPGRPLGQRGVDELLERILFEAGRDLATLHGIPVEGFG